jgi:hypothetical protein
MTTVNVEQQQEEAEFARKATEHFRDHASHYTYADGDPKPGELFAIRWNSFAIIVIRLSSEHEVLNYASYQFIKQDFPKLVPSHPY